MIEVRNKNRPKIFAPDRDDFWGILVLGGLVGLFVVGLLGGILLDAVWLNGPGVDEPNAVEGWDFLALVVWPAIALWTLYPLLVKGSSLVWRSKYVKTNGQAEAVREFESLPKNVQSLAQPAYNVFMQLSGDDPQYEEARKLYNRAVRAANEQEKLLCQRRVDLGGVMDSIEDIETSNKHLKEMMASD